MTEYDNNLAKIDKSFKDWNDQVKREPGSLDNFLVSHHDAARNKEVEINII
jgi:hypothetical protein